MSYTAPIDDMIFALETLGYDTTDLDAIFDEAAKLARDIIAPSNWAGDQANITLKDGVLEMPDSIKDAYTAYRDGGWNTVPFPEEFGGMEMPWATAFPVQEMWQAANMAFGLCPLLNQGAIDAILHHGSDEQKAYYLPRMISGEWTGTMNLTEPQAGSDLSAVTSKAAPQADGTYKIQGQKIFITYGEHDMSDNIIHLVLARTPDAPEGVKGISLFIVPKIMEDGTSNDLICSGIEHKLGIHASPTCTMSFGDNGGATGYLIGEENKGLIYMFTMMNNARLSVGLQGVAIGDRAYQHALAFAHERTQGTDPKTREKAKIATHPDVQRMLMTMKSLTEAGRALTYEAAVALGDDTAEGIAKVGLLTPIVKGFGTENAQEVTSLGVQIHGGMGFVEETGAAQYMRDARILPIYEGTNGIQAIDLVGRKLMDGGIAAKAYIAEMRTHASDEITPYIDALEAATDHMLTLPADKRQFVALNYLMQFGYVAGAVHLARQATAADTHPNSDFATDKKATATFYIDYILPRADVGAKIVLKTAADTVIASL